MNCGECNAPICPHALDAMIGHAGEVERVMEDNVRLREALRELVNQGPFIDETGACHTCESRSWGIHRSDCDWAAARAALEGNTCAADVANPERRNSAPLNSEGQPQTTRKPPTPPVTSPLTREDEDEISKACADAHHRGYQEGVDAATQGLRNIALRVTGIAALHWDDDHLCWCSEQEHDKECLWLREAVYSILGVNTGKVALDTYDATMEGKP